MISAIRATKKQHWSAAIEWLAWTVGVGCVPFWGLLLILLLFAQQMHLEQFIGHAELAVYGAGLVAPAAPLIVKDVTDSPYKQPRWLLFLIVMILLCSAMLFASVTLAGTFPFLPPVNMAVLFGISVTLVVFALIAGFLITLFDNLRLDPNVAAIQQKEQDDLRSAVRKKLGGGS